MIIKMHIFRKILIVSWFENPSMVVLDSPKKGYVIGCVESVRK